MEKQEVVSAHPLADQAGDGFYVRDVDFQSGIIANQFPLHMCTVAAMGGFVPPQIDQEFFYCDLGCGDGTTTNAMAELFPNGRFFGIDFNPGHIDAARLTAEKHGLENVTFIESRFSDLESAAELPQFDLIGMNGIYAWLVQKEVCAVQDFLRQQLKPGGLFYVEYTSLPGKVSVHPLWFLIQHLVPDAEGLETRERAKTGLDLLDSLAKRGMLYLSGHRPAGNAAQSYIRGRKKNPFREDHFAHNALASGFRPRYFTEMFEEMASAGLTYAGRCEFKLNEIEFSVNPAQVPTFQDYKGDVKTVELLKDYIRNEQQRHDIFIKDRTPDPGGAENWLDCNLHLLARMPAAQVQRSITSLGNHKIPLRGPAFEAIIALAGQGSVTPAQAAASSQLPLARVRRAALRLLATDQFFFCREPMALAEPDPVDADGIEMVGFMNRRALEFATERLTRTQLTSTVTGGPAILITAIEAILLKSVLENNGFQGAEERAKEFLAAENRPLPTAKGMKKGRDISESELADILQVMRGRKLINMIRLNIVRPIV